MGDRRRLRFAALSLAGLLLSNLPLPGAQAAHADEPAIIPRPLVVADRPGSPVRFADSTPVLVEHAGAGAAARYLVAIVRRSGGPQLVLAARTHAAVAIRFRHRPGFSREGYAIDIGADGATVTASAPAGSFYGAMSLWQLLAAAPDGRIAPRHIEDEPRFPWRGLVLDSARHFQSPAAIARILDWMAVQKLNRLQWHLADDQGWRLQINRYPRLTSVGAWRAAAGQAGGRYGGFYTQAQVRHIVALATERNITVVPEIEMPGHATAAILAYPDVGLTTVTKANLGDWGVFPSIYDVDGHGLTFLHHVLDEVMALFPSREIAIGGDEAVHTLWNGSAPAMARMQALGLKDGTGLQAWFIGGIGAYLHTHGRRLVGWDEILADSALPADDIVLSWHGADGAILAARAGHDVVMATAPTLYLDNRQSGSPTEPPGRGLIVSLADVYGYDPGNPPHLAGTAPLDAASAQHVLGVQAALWSEHITSDAQLEAMALPRAAALAEIGWTASGRRDWPSFVARLPAMMASYRALGLRPDDGAFVVQAKFLPLGDHARVSFTRQLAVGDIRYTIDGSAPSLASPRYDGAFEIPLPTHLRAASFAGVQQLSRETDLPLNAISVSRRTSQQLEPCTAKLTLNLAGPASAGGPYLVDLRNPCWIDRGADLTDMRHIAVRVAVLPFNFQLANEPVWKLAPTVFPTGELVIRQGCAGPVLATIPLPDVSGGAAHELVADISTQSAPLQTGAQDLCLTLARPKLDPLWALDWMELRP